MITLFAILGWLIALIQAVLLRKAQRRSHLERRLKQVQRALLQQEATIVGNMRILHRPKAAPVPQVYDWAQDGAR